MVGTTTLIAEKREGTGKGEARSLRRDNKVPAIIYGNKQDEVKISTSLKELQMEYMKGGFKSRVIDVEIDGKKIHTLPRDVQLHPVTDIVQHVDFLRIEKDTKVHVFVRVKFVNADKSPGLKRGGVLNVIRREVEMLCRADSIPKVLIVDLDGVKIADSIHVSSINLPEGAVPAITDRDFTIASVAGRTAEEAVEEVAEAEEGEEGAEAAEAAEGEESSAEGGDAEASEGDK